MVARSVAFFRSNVVIGYPSSRNDLTTTDTKDTMVKGSRATTIVACKAEQVKGMVVGA